MSKSPITRPQERPLRYLQFPESMIRTLMMVAALVAILAEAAAAQNATSGENIFKQCMICHAVGPDARNKIGPELNGLEGRHAGSVTNFNYSDANKNSGFVWNEATFKQYIANPQAMIPGTKMAFVGLKDPQRINDLWAYLEQFNADGHDQELAKREKWRAPN